MPDHSGALRPLGTASGEEKCCVRSIGTDVGAAKAADKVGMAKPSLTKTVERFIAFSWLD